ncbi:MAG: iron chelate uptake ABC transporter family permease subunit, partial [Flavobacteriaceae bacterium]|nr:iron chelate uptake ABC transporter family permease subunit [Flavobacteriaceae bacterium]
MPKIIIASLVALIVCFLLNISLGSVAISLGELWQSLIGKPTESATDFILWQHRFPKAFTALFCGAGLALSGLLMQVLFRNPLAGPFVLGISNGAGLGVALLIMGSSLIGFQMAANASGVMIAAILGSLLVLLSILSVSFIVKDTLSLLIVGLMFGSLAGA